MEENATVVYVGVDWATEEHEVCALDASGDELGRKTVPHSPEGLAEFCDWLFELGHGQPETVRIAIEVPHGSVVETLLERGFAVYSINPKQLDRFRDRFSVAGAKDDRLDALVLASSLRTDAHCYRWLEVEAPVVIELREWSRMLDELKKERVRLCNREREQLRRYYPQMLELSPDVHAEWFLDIWALAPTPAKAKRTRKALVQRVERVLKKHRIRRIDAQAVVDTLRKPSLTVAAVTTEAASAHIRLLAERIRVLDRQVKQAERRLDELFAALVPDDKPVDEEDSEGERCEPCDVEILLSLPGVGRIVLATLLAEAPRPLEARDYHALRCHCGVAPVTRRSGKKLVVEMRNACNGRLRNAVYHWSRVAVQKDPAARQRYAALRGRGHKHGRALRTVGDRLLNVACAMLRDRTLYDPNKRSPATGLEVRQ